MATKDFTLYYTKHNKWGEIVSRSPCFTKERSPMTHAECVTIINKHSPHRTRGLMIVSMQERLQDENP